MPIYEYACTACFHRLEALQKMSDEPLMYCPECGEATLKKQVSAAAFRLKGTGWYETDFKNKDSDGMDKADSNTAKSATDDGKKDKLGSQDMVDKKANKKVEKKIEKGSPVDQSATVA